MSVQSRVLTFIFSLLSFGVHSPLAPEAQQQSATPPASAWVKLCEKIEVTGIKKTLCLTHHERIDSKTGMVLVSAAIREMEGEARRSLMVMVPLGMAQAPGMQVRIYPADMWAKIQKGEKVDDSTIVPLKLPFTLCHAAGCTGEIDATSNIMESFKTNGGLLVYAVSSSGKPVAFPVPLVGFASAFSGPPVDNAEYGVQRRKLMASIQQSIDKAAGKTAQVTEEFKLGRRIALVIGNSTYKNAPLLSNPKNDARSVATALRQLGFAEVIERMDLDFAQLSAELKALGDKAANADWAVIYFAGHGVQVDGNSYILPTDVVLDRAAHISDEAISVDRVLTKVADAKLLRLVILDSCRNNPFVSRMARAGGTRSLARGLGAVEPGGGVLVAYAARDGQTAEDGSDLNSPFAKALVRHLEEPGLEINLLFRRVRDSVLKATDGRQEPFTYGSLPGASFYFKSAAK